MKYYVEIIESTEPEKVVNRLGPFYEHTANKVENRANINLNHEKFYTRIVSKEK